MKKSRFKNSNSMGVTSLFKVNYVLSPMLLPIKAHKVVPEGLKELMYPSKDLKTRKGCH